MKNLNLVNRYGDVIPCIWNEDDRCYIMNTQDVYYVSVVYDPEDNNTILGIDPEGLHMIYVGAEFEDTGMTATKIVPCDGGFKIYF